MAPVILVAAATGKTGRGVVRALSADPGPYKIIATTRSASGEVAQELAALPHITVVEKDWTLIDAAWLREHDVRRAYIAAVASTTHFTDESLFLLAALEARVEYLVRISTTASNVSPTTPVFGRNHWAIETLLATPEFAALKWTSIRPNAFTQFVAASAVAWLQQYRKTGKKEVYRTMFDEHNPVAPVDSVEVGATGAALLRLPDPSLHYGKRYTLVGPEDINGADLVKLLERYAGAPVEAVFRDTSFLTVFAKAAGLPENTWSSLNKSAQSTQEGKCSLEASPTSPELLELRPPKNGALEQIDALLRDVQ